MSVPTFTSISPASGLSIGLTGVKIVGTNFRPAPSPPPVGYTGTGSQQTMSVTFNGVEADAVMVADSTTIWTATPEYFGDDADLPDTVDVVLTNLDDDGNPISGETVTEADAFTYKRQDMSKDTDGAIKWVSENLILWFRRHLIQNIAIMTDPEYADNPSAGVIALGELPAIVLVGPSIRHDPVRVDNVTHDIEISGESGISHREIPRRPVILGFQTNVYGRTKAEAMKISEAIEAAVGARQQLRMLDQRGGSDTITLQMMISEGSESFDDTTTHGRRVSSAVELHGVRLRGAYGNETGPQVSKDQPVTYESGDDAFTLEISNSV
jgi:hypothetical protein